MTIGTYIRNKVFKTIDALGGESIQKYVKELQLFEYTVDKHSVIQEKLNRLLNLIQSSSLFYQNKKGVFDLNAYPVITKSFLINNADQFRSIQYIKKLIKVSTSGSYGTPFSFYLTTEKKKKQKAEVIYYGLDVGYEVGICHANFRTVMPKSSFKLWLQNEIFICCKIFGDDYLKGAREELKRKKLKILFGFPSAITILAQFCIDQGDLPKDFVIEGVVTYAESLSKNQRDCISQAFGCKVCSRYGTEELGILGCQSDNEHGFILNTYNYVIEVLKLHEDVSVQPGEIGRVVVTDLHSDAFPLIRYETGDLAILGEVFQENGAWAKSFQALSGRSIQMLYATNGEKLYPLYFENIIEKIGLFVQYQLIQQTEKEFTLKLVPRTTFDVKEFSEMDLINELRDWLGDDALIKLQVVEDIEILPSGKRPSIINRLVNV